MENKPPIIETKNYRKKKDPKKPIKIALAGVAAAAVLGVGIWAVIPKHSNGYDVTSSLTDEVHNHDFINVLSLEEPTCERSGRKVLSCACGEQSVLELMPKGHEEVFAPGVEATCTKEGISDSAFCSACGMVLKPATPIPMISHEEEMIEGKAPTCTEEGVCDGKKCTVCGEITEPMVPIPALGHTEAVWEGKAATCTEPKTCTKCFATVGDVLDHTINCNGYCTMCNKKITVDMRTLVGKPSECSSIKGLGFCFYQNSEGKIKVCWGGENLSGKTITSFSLTIQFYNADGEPAYSKTTGKSGKTVSYKCNVLPNKDIVIFEVIDCVEDCYGVVIGDITLEYSDGTSDTGWYGWGTKHKKDGMI